MATTNVTMRLDENLKKEAEELFSDLGLNLTTAFTVFVKQAVREQKIPFVISKRIPNAETLEAMNEVRDMKNSPNMHKSYTDVDEMIKELLE